MADTTEVSLEDGVVIDFISGTKQLKETLKEQVRQRIARALWHEYQMSPNDMEGDFIVKIEGKRRKADIAIFHASQPHTSENVSRVVMCEKEPKVGPTSLVRTPEQAQKDLEGLQAIMSALPNCKYGLWTNGLELFFVEKAQTRFQIDFKPIGDWPPSGESAETREVASTARLRPADAYLLRSSFRRCHNFIHGNEGMPKDAAFWQFLYLIFCKMHDENEARQRKERRFWAGPTEQFDPQGQKQIRQRIQALFDEVKQNYKPTIFRGNEEIMLSDRALAFIVSEMAKYDFTRTEVDAKGAAYQEIVGDNLRGDRGQYFTPRGVVKMAVEMLAPRPNERSLDPACGTGGFLVQILAYMLDRFHREANAKGNEDTEEFESVHSRLREFAQNQVFGVDFDPFLVRASQMNMVMSGDGRGHLYNVNSLEFPEGHLSDLARARKEIPLAPTNPDLAFDVVMTNPPFGSDIPVSDPAILKQYELAQDWEKLEDGNFRMTGRRASKVAPEILFVERCLQWLKPGGRLAIVLPNGILGNPSTEYIRWWIMRKAWVLASVDLPVEAFIVEANVNILTSVLLLKKKTEREIRDEQLGAEREYPIFMAVAEKVGFDRRGNPLFKRQPDGEEKMVQKTFVERVGQNHKVVTRTVQRRVKEVDDDLPDIASTYRAFLEREAPKYPHLRSLLQ